MADPICRFDSLHIDVEVYGGADIPTAIYQMVQLANRIGVDVWASLNGVRTLARPGDDAMLITEEWSRALRRPYKYASAKRSESKGDSQSDIVVEPK